MILFVIIIVFSGVIYDNCISFQSQLLAVINP